MNEHPINRWNGTAPILMSGAALMMVVFIAGKHGFPPLPRQDENAADHIFIILTFLQIPIIMSFVFSGRRELKRIAPVLALQLSLLAISIAAINYLT